MNTDVNASSGAPPVVLMAPKQEYVLGFCFILGGTGDADDTQVLLIRKKGKLNGIGGHVYDSETPPKAMHREWLEVTGEHVVSPPWQYFLTLEYPDAIVHCFRRFVFSTMARKVTPYSVDCIPTDSIPNLHWILPIGRALPSNVKAPHFIVVNDNTNQ